MPEIEREVAPVTDHESVDDPPRFIDEGEAEKEEMTGAPGSGTDAPDWVVAVTDELWDEAFPAASYAEIVYEYDVEGFNPLSS
jgi:hypothetical protein